MAATYADGSPVPTFGGEVIDQLKRVRDADQSLARGINDYLPVPVLPVPDAGSPDAPVVPLDGSTEPQAGPETTPVVSDPSQALGTPGSALPPLKRTEITQTVLSPEAKAVRETGNKLANQQMQGINAERDAAKKAEGEKSRVAQEEHVAETTRLDAEAQNQEGLGAQLEALAQQQNTVTQYWDGKLQEGREAVQKAHQERQRDPYDEMGLGTKVLRAFMLAADTYTSIKAGQDPAKSPVMALMDRGINELVARREREYVRSKEFMQEAAKGKDEALASLKEFRALATDQAIQRAKITLAKADAIKAKSKNPEYFQVLRDAAEAGLDNKAMALKQDLIGDTLKRLETDAKKVSTTITTPNPYATRGAGSDKLTIADRGGNIIGKAKTPALANEAAERLSGVQDATRLGQELSQHIKTHGMTVLPGQTKADRDALVRDLASALVKARSGTAASDKEREALTSTIMPTLLNQVTSSRGDSAGTVEKFVARETARYDDFANSAMVTPGKGGPTPLSRSPNAPQGAAPAQTPAKPAPKVGDVQTVSTGRKFRWDGKQWQPAQ